MARPQTRREAGLALFHDVEKLLEALHYEVPTEVWDESDRLWDMYACTDLGELRELHPLWSDFERRVRSLEVRLACVWVGEVRA